MNNSTFANEPLIHQVNLIILTLFQITIEQKFSWEQFANSLILIYEYVKKWNEIETSKTYYNKLLSEILPILDNYYKVKEGNLDSNLLRMIQEVYNKNKNVYVSLKHLPGNPECKSTLECLKEYFALVLHRVHFEFKKLENKKDTLHYIFLNGFLNLLNCSEQKDEIFESLMNSKFDKRKFQPFLTHSIIFGADEGIYMLLNSLSIQESNLLLDDSIINKEMWHLIINEKRKIIIGEGSFGKIRMAMVLVPNKKEQSSMVGGNIICVKKAGSKNKPKTQMEVWESTWNDYCSIDFLDDAPEIFDMKITMDRCGLLQGYCFQKLLMLPNGTIFFKNEEYQSWLHVKHYFIGIFKLMIDLHKKGICMTDLKPANTLYDIKTRTTKLVDLAGAVRNENLSSCKKRKVTEMTPKYTAPELLDSNLENAEENVDLPSCISWTVGKMLKEIYRTINQFKNLKKSKKNEEIAIAIKDLYRDLKKSSSSERISLQEGLARIQKIPDLEVIFENNFETYICELRERFTRKDSYITRKLNLKNEIYILRDCFNEKLKITSKNPEKFNYDISTDSSVIDLLPALENFLFRKEESEKEAFVLFGAAGSGKSTLLQKMFIDKVLSWNVDDPIPVFMNLAIEHDFKKFWRNLMDCLMIPDLQFENLIRLPISLFLDSLDESRMDLRLINNIFNSSLSYSNEKSFKIIITCRTGYFKEDEEKRLKGNINLKFGYILPLDFFFLHQNSNLENFIKQYLKQWEKKLDEEIPKLALCYLQKIHQFQLTKIMKTTYMIFLILNILPKLMETDALAREFNLLKVYEMYIEHNIEKEILKTDSKMTKQKRISWYMQIGVLLAEQMMSTKKAANQLKKKKVVRFLSNSLFAEVGEAFNRNVPLIENVNIYNVLRTLNLNLSFEKEPPNEEITISFPHETIKNFFITKGLIEKHYCNHGFPEWISQKLFIEDKNFVSFVVEAVKSSSELAFEFEKAIFLTKQSDNLNTMIKAANLITFLVASNYSFYGKDLSHVKVKGANLSDGIFYACNFDYADLSQVNLRNIKMDGASFLNTNFDQVQFDIFPFLKGHSSSVNSVAFSPNGKKVASGSDDKSVIIWDIDTWSALLKYQGHMNSVNSLAFSSNGEIIVSGSCDKTIQVWNFENGKQLKIYRGHLNSITSVAISQKGDKIISGSKDKTIGIWDLVAERLIQKCEGHSRSVNSVAFSPDEKNIVSGSLDNTIRIWNLENGKEIKKIEGHFGSVNSVSYSLNGDQILSCSKDSTIRIWDVQTGKEFKKYEGYSDPVYSVAFSPNCDKIISGSREVIIWDVEANKKLKSFEGHSGSITSVAFSADGLRIVTGSIDKTLRIWNLETVGDLKKYEGHFLPVNSVNFLPDGDHIISASYDNSIRLWDIQTGKELKKYEGHSASVTSVIYSAIKKEIISCSYDKTIRIWSLETGKELKKYEWHYCPVYSIALSPDEENLISASFDKTFKIWNLKTGKELQKFEGHSRSVNSVIFSPKNGRELASGSFDMTARIWNTETGKELRKFVGHLGSVTAVAFFPSGDILASASEDKTIRTWDLKTGQQLIIFEGHSRSVNSISFCPEGSEIVSCSNDKSIRIWEVESGKLLKIYEGHSDSIYSVAFSKNGDKLVSGSFDKTIRIWDCKQNKISTDQPKMLNSLDWIEVEQKNALLIISVSNTSFSCLNCRNYEKSLNCCPNLLSILIQNDRFNSKNIQL